MTPPSSAAAVFGDRLALALRYAEWLTGPGITRGLLGPREGEHIWERHILNGVALTELIGRSALVVDLGSGAGLPGIPLLLARPDLEMVLVEPKQRRVEFLTEVCAELGLSARVVRARATPAGLVLLPKATSLTLEHLADVVTARAVAPLADLGAWAAPLLRQAGQLLAIKGETAAEELRRDRSLLGRAGLHHPEVRTVNLTVGREDLTDGPATTVVAVTLGHVSRET